LGPPLSISTSVINECPAPKGPFIEEISTPSPHTTSLNLTEDIAQTEFSFSYFAQARMESEKQTRKRRIDPLLKGLGWQDVQTGEIDWSNLVFTSNQEEIDKYSLQPNTILFNRTNSPELVGKTAIYRGERPAIFAGYLIRINTTPLLSAEYLNLCFNTHYGREFCRRVKTDDVSQSIINAQKLGLFEVPLPPVGEQEEIVGRMEALFATAEALEARYRTAKAHVDKLTQSSLARAFRGELVPQDPNDEPGSVLLERIHQSSDAGSVKKRRAGR
jgi:type I restriction enzyme S subunit